MNYIKITHAFADRFPRIFKKKQVNEPLPTMSFQSVISFVQNGLKHYAGTQDKILFIEYVMDTIRKDIQYDYLSRYFYSNDNKSLKHVIPYYFYDNNYNKVRISDDGEELVEISSANTTIISFPWNVSKLAGILPHIKKNGFKYDNYNHFGEYFSQLDICYMTNGFHSSTVGIHLNNAVIKASPCHVERMYDYVYTDGEFWRLTFSGEEYSRVEDFRTAALYEISKIKYNLSKQPQ